MSRIKGVIGISGVYCGKIFSKSWLMRWLYLQPAFGPNSANWHSSFPTAHVKPTAPPFLLLNASFDLALEKHTTALVDQLQAAGIWVRTYVVPRTHHMSIVSTMGRKVIAWPAEALKDVKEAISRTGAVETTKQAARAAVEAVSLAAQKLSTCVSGEQESSTRSGLCFDTLAKLHPVVGLTEWFVLSIQEQPGAFAVDSSPLVPSPCNEQVAESVVEDVIES